MNLEVCAECELVECDTSCQIYIDVKADRDYKEIRENETFFKNNNRHLCNDNNDYVSIHHIGE